MGQELRNALSGVPKEDVMAEGFDENRCTLRLIANLIPVNELCRDHHAEMDMLPVFTLWLKVELHDMEASVHPAEDMSAAFFHFRMERELVGLFALEGQRNFDIPQIDKEATIPALAVLPMGWKNAAGLMEHIMLQLSRQARASLPAESRPGDLGRRSASQVDSSGRIKHFITHFLDNWDEGRIDLLSKLQQQLGSPSQAQVALRAVFDEWNVARAFGRQCSRSS